MDPEKDYDSEPAEGARGDLQNSEDNSRLVAIDSEALLKGAKEILIRHHGQIYRLRLTRNDKLILHK